MYLCETSMAIFTSQLCGFRTSYLCHVSLLFSLAETEYLKTLEFCLGHMLLYECCRPWDLQDLCCWTALAALSLAGSALWALLNTCHKWPVLVQLWEIS